MTRLRLILATAAVLIFASVAYIALNTGETAQAHSCGHVEFHSNHTVGGVAVKGNHANSLGFQASAHGHEHQERDVIYIDYSTGSIRYVWHANGEHMHCLITKVGGM